MIVVAVVLVGLASASIPASASSEAASAEAAEAEDQRTAAARTNGDHEDLRLVTDIKQKLKTLMNETYIKEKNQPKSKALQRTAREGDVVLPPNLFGAGKDIKSLMANMMCKEAFNISFEESRKKLQSTPKMKVVTLPGNASETRKWKEFFNKGEETAEGYDECFEESKTPLAMGSGPCAEAFFGRECQYFPQFAVFTRFFPACCDRTGCACMCMYDCTTANTIKISLATHLVDSAFHECTTNVSSNEEAVRWKEARCKASQYDENYNTTAAECAANGTKPICIRSGTCIGDICKMCYRWDCDTVPDVLSDDKKDATDSEKRTQSRSASVNKNPEDGAAKSNNASAMVIVSMEKAWQELSALD